MHVFLFIARDEHTTVATMNIVADTMKSRTLANCRVSGVLELRFSRQIMSMDVINISKKTPMQTGQLARIRIVRVF